MKRRMTFPKWLTFELLIVLSPLFGGLLIGLILVCTGSSR